MKSWQDCPWLQVRDYCELNNEGLMCLKNQCPIVKLDAKIDRMYKHLDVTHLETTKKLDADIKAVMDTVGGLAEDVARQQEEIELLKKR